MTHLVVEACGPATSIQDRGRFGVARLGLARAGAMDPLALASANALCGNPEDTAAIELAFVGGRFRVSGGSARLAVAGAPVRIDIDGEPQRQHASFVLSHGQVLRIGRTEAGAYAMLGVEGGFALPPVLGSLSLDVRAGIGGHDGRRLRAGDELPLVLPQPPRRREWVAAAVELEAHEPLRVVPGPQLQAFPAEAVASFLRATYQVSHQLDRMACKLDGPVVARSDHGEMVSEALLPGSIQIPPDGVPIVMLADRQTIGGYPKIATVLSCDLRRLAQRWPGAQVRFEPVSVEAAGEISRAARRRARATPIGPAQDFDTAALQAVGDCAVHALEPQAWDPGGASRAVSIGAGTISG